VVREFKFDTSYEEVKINDRMYQIDISDDKLVDYQELFSQYQKESQSIAERNTDNATKEETQKFLEDSKTVLKKILETMLGEGTFEQIYNESGKSIVNVSKLIIFLADIMNEKTGKMRDEERNKYLKNKKKNKKAARKAEQENRDRAAAREDEGE
jgi:hypothetical protein